MKKNSTTLLQIAKVLKKDYPLNIIFDDFSIRLLGYRSSVVYILNKGIRS